MKSNNYFILSTSPLSQPAKKPHGTASLGQRQRLLYGRKRRHSTGKERDNETGLYYYGARYLDSKTSRWLSGDPAMGDYVPSAPINDEARKRNKSLPGQGGVFNYVNLHVYHYAGNNPVKLVDPNGEKILQVSQKYLMTSNAYQDEKLGGSNTPVAKEGCFVVSMANSEYSFRNLKDNPRHPDLVLKTSRDKNNFENSTPSKFKFGEHGKALFGNEMQTISQGDTDNNSSVLAELNELKSSDDTYAVFGIFTTDYGDHMVPLNDTAQNNSFKDSIIKSSKNDTNNRFNESNLKEIRYFKIKDE